MKLTILNWFKDELIPLIGKLIEILFRILLFILPLGVFLIIIQYRGKVSKVSNLSVYTNEESVWQHIYPGFALIAISPETNKKNIYKFYAVKSSSVPKLYPIPFHLSITDPSIFAFVADVGCRSITAPL